MHLSAGEFWTRGIIVEAVADLDVALSCFVDALELSPLGTIISKRKWNG